MSVLVEAVTVVVRNDAVERRLPGGVPALAAAAPNGTFRTDGKLAAVGFMIPADVEVYVLALQQAGLQFVEHDKSRDFVVIDAIRGPTFPCDWIEMGAEPDGTRFAWLRGTPPGTMAAFDSWKRGALAFRSDMDVERLKLDPETGLRFYVDENGVKQYVGEAFSADDPQARLLRARWRLIGKAKQAAWKALLKRGWQGIAVPESPDPDFHIAMRYKNQLGLVFVAADWNSTPLTEFDRDRRERLLARAETVRGAAILSRCTLFAPIRMRSSGAGPIGTNLQIREGDLDVDDPRIEALTFEDVASAAPLEERKFDTRARIEISDWEVLDFAIQIVRNALEQQGYRIDSWTSEPGPGAHIVAHKDGADTHIIVGAARYPVEPIFDRDRLKAVAASTLNEGALLATAAVSLAHDKETFGGDGALPLYRGDPATANFPGLVIIDAAGLLQTAP